VSRHRMSEKEKAYFFVLLFPPLWPLGIAMIMCDIGEAIGRGATSLYRRLRRVVGSPKP